MTTTRRERIRGIHPRWLRDPERPPVGVGLEGRGHLHGPLVPLTREQVHHARITVAARALDPADCRDLLDALGIGPEMRVLVEGGAA